MSPAFGLELTNTPRMAKVLGLNLTEPVIFFQMGNFLFHKKMVGFLLLCLCFVGLVLIL